MNGASFARRFARGGYTIALLSRSTEFADELAKELGDAKAYACDVTDAAAVKKSFDAIRKDFGDPTVVVYNAGSGVWGDLDKIRPEDFERTWRINALGAFLVAKEVVPAMKTARQGNFVFVGATASLRGKPVTTAFASAKAAQRSLAQSMARQLGPTGIHVALLIVDGRIATPASEGEEREAKALDPDDIAQTAFWITEQPRSAWSFEVDVRPWVENW